MNVSKRKSGILGRIFAVFLVAELLLLPYAPVSAKRFPSASQMAAELEQRYHINTGAIQNAGENFNVSDGKKTVPEVSLFFSPSDPKEGQKITAKSFPIYFSNPPEQLYYTWFLKQRDRDDKYCDIDSSPSGTHQADCDDDKDGKISENDWKVRAARIIAQSGYDNGNASYDPDTADADSDGFSATGRFGGSFETGKNDWCYLYDTAGGTIYEITRNGGSFAGCDQSAGERPVCISQTTNIASGSQTCDSGTGTCTGTTYTESGSGDYYISGTPSCSGGAPSCGVGSTPRCIGKDDLEPFTSAPGSSLSSCVSGNPTPDCQHIFPSSKGVDGAGDGDFDNDEERFWGTDPADADTADNGNKDEANVIGLGVDSFTWNYRSGDMVGLGVEGISMIPTKHDDSSNMVMWAFSKNKCDVGASAGYTTVVKGYSVYIPTTDKDVNDCVKDNLVDPLEGGQAKKLELEVSATPENPTNDETAEKGGDVVSAIASVSNSTRSLSELSYDWKVSISDNPNTEWQDVTSAMKAAGLLQASAGNGLSSISIALNMQTAFLDSLDLDGKDPLYLKIAPTVTENFSSGVARKGTSDVIVRVSNTTNKIVPYSATAALSGTTYKVSYGIPICNDPFIANPTTAADAMQNLNRIACRVMKNEIIGLKFANDAGLSDFQWTLNGSPITCSANVSNACGNGIFFAVAGNPGETYTIKASAVDTTSGKSVSLARTFQIVEPEVVIESADQTSAWPKYIGTHTDLDGNSFDEYSDIAFETYGTGSIKLKARFLPGPAKFVSSDPGPDGALWTADDIPMRTWTIDGQAVDETAVNSLEIDYAPTTPKLPGEVYNVSFNAMLVQPVEKRQALKEIWGIDTLASTEIRISQGIQVDVVEAEDIVQGPKKFLAAISSYLPASVLFAFKITLSMALLLFTVGFVFALIPAEPRTDEVILSRRD